MHAAVVSVLIAGASLTQYGPYYQQPYQPQYGPPPRVFIYGHGPIKKDELEYQQQAFKQWWGDDLVLKLSDLPAEGKVPEYRVPYAGHDYPDRAGGTINALVKYDQAFHRGRMLATDFERQDVSAHRNSGEEEIVIRGMFGRVRTIRTGRGTPTWYGHCNGWTAAAIRHAEPQRAVARNGVVFTPADIKGLLAELYMYTDSEFLGGVDPAINPGILHVTLANWLGRGSHPVGMETAVGEVVINFPVFNYKSVVKSWQPREAEVKTTITYTLNINRELDKSPANYHRQLYFHYALDLDEEGIVRGGRFYSDSAQIDMLWTPLQPVQGGEEKNKRGNPHLNVKEVLAIWRESVSEDLRKRWLNIDPTEEDRILPPAETAIAAAEPPAAGGPAATPAAEATAAATPPADAAAAPAAGAVAAAPVETPNPGDTPAPLTAAATTTAAEPTRGEGSSDPVAPVPAPTPLP